MSDIIRKNIFWDGCKKISALDAALEYQVDLLTVQRIWGQVAKLLGIGGLCGLIFYYTSQGISKAFTDDKIGAKRDPPHHCHRQPTL